MNHMREPVPPVESRLEKMGALGAPDRIMLRAAVEHAILAPSSHNAQPWTFRIREDALELFADRSRALSIVDPDDRELTIGCGAALQYARLALRAIGRRSSVELLPEPGKPDLLARIRVGGPTEPTGLELRLVDAMFARRTHRRAFMEWPVNETLLTLLEEEAKQEGVWFAQIKDQDARAAVADLVSTADRLQWEDPLFRDELAFWLRSSHTSRRDGMPGYALGVSSTASALAPSVVRRFDMGDGRAASDRELVDQSPVLVCLGTRGDTARDWLLTGQVLARVWLHATVEGVSASFLNQPIEIAALRPRIEAIVGRDGHAQLLMRMGYGYPLRGTPRRDISEVLEA